MSCEKKKASADDCKKNETPAFMLDGSENARETVPFDPRFPNTNQTVHCFVNFLDYHRCIKKRGEDYVPCQYFFRAFKDLCPIEWVEKWTEQLENGTFPGNV